LTSAMPRHCLQCRPDRRTKRSNPGSIAAICAVSRSTPSLGGNFDRCEVVREHDGCTAGET